MQSTADHISSEEDGGVLRSVGRAIALFLLSKLSSRHGKRILFISSLYFHVAPLERMTDEAITKLNTVMGLAKDARALRFPVWCRGLIWDKTDIDKTLSREVLDHDIDEAKATEVARQVVEMAPRQWRYGRQEDMISHVKTLILNGSRMAA